MMRRLVPAITYFPPCGVSSALRCFTTLFGMGRGSSIALNHRNRIFESFKFIYKKYIFYLPRRKGVSKIVACLTHILPTPPLPARGGKFTLCYTWAYPFTRFLLGALH